MIKRLKIKVVCCLGGQGRKTNQKCRKGWCTASAEIWNTVHDLQLRRPSLEMLAVLIPYISSADSSTSTFLYLNMNVIN